MVREKNEDLNRRGLGTTWFTVFASEYILTFIINAFTLIAFARNRHLRKRSTYLIINLTVADLLVGAVSGPLHIYHTVTFDPGSGFSWKKFIVLTFDNVFTASSIAYLSLISLERLYVTIYPFRQRLVSESIYFHIMPCVWLLALIPASLDAFFFLEKPFVSRYVWASFISPAFLIQTISYVSITAKVKRDPPIQRFGAIASERKLSGTLLIVTFVSALNILPWVFYAFFYEDIVDELSKNTEFFITNSVNALFYVNSFINPVIYAIRMQSFRKALYNKTQLIWRKTAVSKRVQPIELQSIQSNSY